MMFMADILASRVQSDAGIWDQVVTFFSFQHVTLVYGAIGAMLLGICCGLLGCFIVLRKMSLLGDSIGHAVLPGICVAFIVMQTKHAAAIFVGAIVAGVLAAWAISSIVKYSRIKADTAIGLVLSGFFGFGIVLLTRIQRMAFGDQSGLDKYMFGDAAALGVNDLKLMAVVTVVVLIIIITFFRYFLTTSFDEAFASSVGMPTRLIQTVLMTLLALAIVVSLQAVGVVLVSAMLIIPAATAYLLTDRLWRMLGLSALLGVGSGLLGLFLSFILHRIPTGPCMVLAASFFFVLAYAFSPKQGVVFKAVRQFRRRRRVQGENLLKTVYGLLDGGETGREFLYRDLAELRNESVGFVRRVAKSLAGLDMAQLTVGGMKLTPSGIDRAAQVIRNHRLWELYLTQEADIADDHVHRDAEDIEHVLGEEMVARLEKMLNYPDRDPHGRLIPQRSGASSAERGAGDG
ncbi:MAG: metal ABC transporter permease [Planctomycetota bacterium]|jgi:manganese/zinc/iron transport system permease protein